MLKIAAYYQFSYQSLLILCGLFTPHVTRSRYPFPRFKPLEVYTDRYPLIDKLADFIGIAEYALESLDSPYSDMSRLFRK